MSNYEAGYFPEYPEYLRERIVAQVRSGGKVACAYCHRPSLLMVYCNNCGSVACTEVDPEYGGKTAQPCLHCVPLISARYWEPL